MAFFYDLDILCYRSSYNNQELHKTWRVAAWWLLGGWRCWPCSCSWNPALRLGSPRSDTARHCPEGKTLITDNSTFRQIIFFSLKTMINFVVHNFSKTEKFLFRKKIIWILFLGRPWYFLITLTFMKILISMFAGSISKNNHQYKKINIYTKCLSHMIYKI